MMHCLNLNDPTISNIISRIGYLTTSDIITYNGIEILDIVKQQPFLDLKEEIKKSYQYQLNTKEFNQSIDDMVEISFWRIFTPSFYDWFGNWMIQYKLQNNLSLSEKEQDVLSTKYQGSYDNLKADISKIVTEDGLPKLVYHSSLYDFPIFKNRDYIHFGTLKAAEDRLDVMIGRLPFTNDNQFSSILEEQLSNISSQPNAIAGITIKPYFLNIKKVTVSEDVIAGWTGKVLLDELNSGIEYKNELEDKGSISYAIRDINQIKSAILPSEDMSALLVKNLVEELKVTPEQAKPLIPTKFLNPTDSKIVYFQRLNDSTYGFVTPDGKVFIDKSTQSLNTPFHEFYHIYDKIILSNYSFDERAKSIIDRANELAIEGGYLDKVKKLDAYKDDNDEQQLAEARAMLIGDAASSKINEAEHGFLMKLKSLLKDLVDYILDLIGTKSFKDFTPEQILNMTMEEFTNVMTYDMMYNRSFNSNTTNLQNNEISDDREKQIEELFDNNPEIANQVYSVLGYKTEAAKRVEKANEDIKEIHKIGVDTEYEDVVKNSDKNRFHFLDTNTFTDKNQKSVNIEHVRVPEKYRNKGYGLSMYIVRGEELLKEGKFLISYDLHSPEAEIVWRRLLQLGLATRAGEYGTYQYVGLKNQEITPQQKQQALQLYSQYLESLNKPNTNPILQDNQQEQVKKFAELQERLSNKEFLEGAKLAFESSAGLQNVYYEALIGKPEQGKTRLWRVGSEKDDTGIWFTDSIEDLSFYLKERENPFLYYVDVTKEELTKAKAQGPGIGNNEFQFISEKGNKLANGRIKQITPQQKQEALNAYTNYIARVSLGIIKNPSSGKYNYESKVRDIVYHSTDSKFDKFDKNFLETSKAFHFHDGWFATGKDISVVLNIINPNTTEKIPDVITNKRLETFKTNNQDGIVIPPAPDIAELVGKDKKEYVVFEPEQIHILGSKADIQGFKEFVENDKETSQIDLSPQSFPIDSNKVNYVLRTVNILSNLSDKQKQYWRQWQNNKLTNEQLADRLQIPKEQKPLFIEELNDRFLTPEQAIVNLSSKYSFTVEINTAKSTLYKSGYFAQESVYGEWSVYDAQGNTVEDGLTQGEAIRRAKQFNENDSINTQYYSDVTVNEEFYKNNPNWEYKEQRITTPLIKPSIEGHAQFAEANDIGWFRAWYNKKTGEVHVLEVQSDLFQRGRGIKVLSKKLEIRKVGDTFTSNGEQFTVTNIDTDSNLYELITIQDSQGRTATMRRSQLEKRFDERGDNSSENQFLQLLNKDNNWVTFFVKSIIQSTAKETTLEARQEDINAKIEELKKSGELEIQC